MATLSRHYKIHLGSSAKNNSRNKNTCINIKDTDYHSLVLKKVSNMLKKTNEKYEQKIMNYQNLYNEGRNNQQDFTDKIKKSVEVFRSQYKDLDEKHKKSINDNKELQDYIRKQQNEHNKLKGEYTKMSNAFNDLRKIKQKASVSTNKNSTSVGKKRKLDNSKTNNDSDSNNNSSDNENDTLPFF